ncbi:MAG: hypothetical protein ACYSSN_02665 [Planctomycetota bacterium]|jgi:hypothetical protein
MRAKYCLLGQIQVVYAVFLDSQAGRYRKKPLPGGGRGESEITSRSLNVKLDTSQIPSSAGEVK